MHQLLLNIKPEQLGIAPFTPALHHCLDVKAARFGLHTHPAGNVHLLPVIAGFLGADIVAGIVAQRLHHQDKQLLLIDIGTNGEMVLGSRQGLVAASCATGPAFEGAQISHGMRAAEGAIESIEIDPLTWEVRYRVIGSPDRDEAPPPRGICGSAIIDLGWELYQAGIVGENGHFSQENHSPRLRDGPQGREFVIAWAKETALGHDITFNTDDLQALRLAKAAMYCAVKIMMRRQNITELAGVILTGAFGTYIDKIKAMAGGLFPDCDPAQAHTVQNAAGDGARMGLLNTDLRAEADRLARQVEHLELTQEPDFDRLFAAAMSFPHASDEFPHLAPLFETARRRRYRRFLGHLFSQLTPAQLEPLAAAVAEQSYRKRRVICQAGAETGHIYLVAEGQAHLVAENGEVLARFEVGTGLNPATLRPPGRVVAAARLTRVYLIPADALPPALDAFFCPPHP